MTKEMHVARKSSADTNYILLSDTFCNCNVFNDLEFSGSI